MISRNLLRMVASLSAIAVTTGIVLGNESQSQRVGFAFVGYVDEVRTNDPSKLLFHKTIPNGSRVTGTFTYDTGSDGIPGFDGTRVFHQTIEGGFTFNFEGGPLTISASDYTITIGNDYKGSNMPAALDYLSVDYSGLSASPVSPLIADGAVVINSKAVLKAVMTWDVSVWNDPDDPKLRSTLPVGQVLPIQSLAGPALKSFTIISISSVAPSQGDFNIDGKVDLSDFVEWSKAFGESTPDKMYADANRDGIVNAADYVLWRKAFLPQSSGALVHSTVPEPFCTWLIALIMLPFVGRRR